MTLENDPQFQAEAKAEQQFLDGEMYRRNLEHCSKEELLELCIGLLHSEKEKRDELDKLQGIIR